ncbi:LytTR family transcriptional regulator DNA-binding domain-containing protein [Paenibacillus sp. FSL H7-0331]|uniref:LytTR family transcriptional regulator DNA-binding domain-containing protein n=1 Tax=Paenibacillus sp. FSL H7-0331 TaxID=1920421 RepID=UPI00096C742C|nr:LytTR family transcriptional regulator DNA-binding domain-containing protein [Paenibacillus sp. FSL H7-0331]OME97387.1 hypothetical protein BK127_40610 [Paenibacillus sp. FSL H7-0331]
MIFEKLKSLMHEKLENKCDDDEINDLTRSIADHFKNTKNIQFLNEFNELILIDIENVLYVYEKNKNIYSFVTKEEEYELLNKNINLNVLLNDNFYQLDKKHIVNLNQVKLYNSYMGVVYFGEDINDASTKSLRVAIKAVTEIVRKIKGKEKDLYSENDITAIYTPRSLGKNN